MTDFSPPARSGMPLWARWTLFGCGGCLVILLVGFVGCGTLIYQYVFKPTRMINVADKPDLPLTATAAQLFPPRVDSFVRKSLGRYTPRAGTTGRAPGWQAWYSSSGGKRVEVVARPTTAGAAEYSGSPFERQLPRGQNPFQGFHYTQKFGSKTLDMIVWSKPNWTFVIQSPDLAAEAFFRAYRPGSSRRQASGVRR